MAKSKSVRDTAVVELAETAESSVGESMGNQEESGLNAGLLITAEQIKQRREEERLRIQEERTSQGILSLGRMSRLRIKADIPYASRKLHSFDKCMKLFIHNSRGDQFTNEICREHFGEDCDICTMLDSRGEPCRARPHIVSVDYVFNLIGETFDKNVGGEIRKYKINPIKVVQIPYGKNDCNLLVFANAHRLKFYDTEIWQIERQYGKGFLLPTTISPEELRQRAGKGFSLDLPEAAVALSSLDTRGVARYILSAYPDIPWEKLGLEPPGGLPGGDDTVGSITEGRSGDAEAAGEMEFLGS